MTKPIAQSRIREFVDADPEELIRVYTYQAPEAWKAAQKRGYLTGSHNHPNDVSWDEPYEWMREQMAKRIPDFSGDLPVWAWLKRENGKKRVRDPYTRLIALVPRKRILASCYDLWHHPLNNWFIATTEEEDKNYDQRWPKYIGHGEDSQHQKEVELHWEKIFDLREARTGYTLKNYGVLERIQLCVDRIYVNEIVGIRPPSEPLP